MTTSHDHEPPQRLTDDEIAVMDRLGVRRVSVDYFHYGPFRYTNLADALDYAMRHPHAAGRTGV